MSESLMTPGLVEPILPVPELNDGDILDYLKDLINARQAINPDYGRAPDNHQGLDGRQHALVYWLFDHFAGIAIYNENRPLSIDTHGLRCDIGFTDEDIQTVMAAGIMEQDSSAERREGTLERPYRLTRAYDDYRWVRVIVHLPSKPRL